ncbi:MAG: peptidase C1 [Bacteroidetes bacterium]|nr:peptidase C1 [Bacteroidota bacterium]
MPIRMEKDSNQEGSRREEQPRQPKRPGGGNLLKYIPFLLLILWKKPKWIVPILIIGGALYLLFGNWDANLNAADTGGDDDYTFGAVLSEEMFDKAEVFEPLAYGYGNTLPRSVSLERFAPKRLHQGRQGSCVGWASAYAARTILHSRATGQSPNQIPFSPSFLYNQIALSGCQGAYMLDAMKTLHQGGVLPFQDFGYDERTCSNEPGTAEQRAAQQYRIKGYNRLTLGGSNYKPDLMGIKQNLAQGAPIVIGMQVGGSFMRNMMGRDVWRPTRQDYNMYGFSGHAMCVIGYDDDKDGGAFQIMNSWGPEWGNNGIGWVSYDDFDYFVKEAYGLYPMGEGTKKFDTNKMAVEFGLVDIAKEEPLSLFQRDGITFRTLKPIRKGDKFKILFANSIECYVYVFGQETDGSSYVLFPYTSKHSPYCGITGTRLFPKDYSMTADQIGNKDFIAIVVTKEPIDYNRLNAEMNRSRQQSYGDMLTEALSNQRITQVEFKAGQTVAFAADTRGKNAVGMVIEIDKQ